jgi:hypothetical protein
MSAPAIPEDRVPSGHDVRFCIPRGVATAASAVAQRELRNRGLLVERQAETGRGAPALTS